jgi:dihydroxyacetone kinase phosphoprotein-dependent L subunit
MNSEAIGPQELKEIFLHIARVMREREAELNALDAAIGDGDHGITMRGGFEAVGHQLESLPAETTLSEVLSTAGMAFMDATGGAIGVILGKMFLAGGRAVRESSALGPRELGLLLGEMERAVAGSGRARPGDKTILDAVHPASRAVNNSVPAPATLAEALARAAGAAESGAERTAEMLCRVGRASRLGDRVLGHRDPGAVSFALLLRTAADWVAGRKERQAQTD